MQKITPHLWYDKEAVEAANLYTSLFKNSRIKSKNVIHDTPSGDCDILSIELEGQEFMLISAGPYFKFTPAISFLVGCESKEEVQALWDGLIPGGKALMELSEYPFSEKYGWLQDKFGLSWQIMYLGERELKQKITPVMMFVGDNCGKAEEAIDFYASLFPNSERKSNMRYEKDEEPDKEGTLKHAAFTLAGQYFAAMDSAHKHDFSFNEAVSLIVKCEDQAEIDHYWHALSAVSESEQCGWLKDKFGVSWQITPKNMDELMSSGDQEKVARVTQAFLKMKKFNIAELEKAAEGS